MAGKDKDKDAEVTNPDVFPKPPESDWGVELGVEFNLPFATPYTDGLGRKAKADKELRELLKEEGEDLGPTVSQLVAMRRLDGQARALYRLLTLPIRAALSQSKFVPADGGEAEAEFIDLQFNLPPASGGMSVTFHKFMAQLLQGLFDGFAPFEQVYDYQKYGPLKGKYVLRKLAYRQPNTITFIEDKDGHFQGFRQRAYKAGEVIDIHIPRENAFYFAAQEEERKYYGVSFFQSAFYHYDKKVKMYYIAHLAAQRAAVGTRVGTFPQNSTEQQKRNFAQNLSNLAVAQWMMIPEQFKVEMLKEGGGFAFLDYINHHNSQMSKSILANFFDKETGGGSDSPVVSFGQPGDSMFILMLRAIMDDIANSINHYIIPTLIDWNFEGGKYPTFRWAELTDEQKAMISDTFDKLSTAGAGVNVSPEFIRELEKKMAEQMGLELDWDEIEGREEQEKETANLMQGIGPDGKPLPTDAMGNPIMPGEANPDQMLADFEAAAVTAGAASAEGAVPGEEPLPPEAQAQGQVPANTTLPESTSPLPAGNEVAAPNTKTPEVENNKKKKKVALATDPLLGAAQELLELARPVSGDYRVVRTQEGADRFGVRIGEPIPTGAGNGEEGGVHKVTIERLQNLKAQWEEFKNAGNTAEAEKAMIALRRAYYDYSGSWKPSDFISQMRNL